ncbi:hypothetical protein [Phreatobacter aquaticus]|uniref:hypothetical protein n=1 Tax=Phreatobacter aquaticus TaxID=2570229 RepID=UPI00143CFB27|nr:hypothetical protein [Phreatobacter aquaticus]
MSRLKDGDLDVRAGLRRIGRVEIRGRRIRAFAFDAAGDPRALGTFATRGDALLAVRHAAGLEADDGEDADVDA